ncbi:MAG: class 1 fructose-bisphosphatase [Deltaproteobacteria bacterium]|nr:class 1 fructose-bisphosphatase [Deltaproteobacteria bacterium]
MASEQGKAFGQRIVTLERHIIDSQRDFPGASGAFSQLLTSIGLAAKVITREVRRAGLVDILGKTGDTNVQGEEVTKLDVYAHQLMVRMLGRSGQVCGMASEEEDIFISIPSGQSRGAYIVCFDPLDGSSNIDVNATIGTIFGIWRVMHREAMVGEVPVEEAMQPGRALVGAGYVIYGSSTIFVYTTGSSVHGFTLDPTIGEFLLSHPNIRTPARGGIYSVNEGNASKWDPRVREYIETLKGDENARGKPYSARYIGSLVADFHRNLLKGGIFLYPADVKNKQGKLRLMFEAAPLAFVCEAAGGAATDGTQRILDLEPEDLHQRVPLIIGSADDVAEATAAIGEP